jgi:hypothetical protein
MFRYLLYATGLALSQFYLFDSGIPQPSHYLLALSAGLSLLQPRSPSLRQHQLVSKGPLLWLTAYAAVTNLAWSLWLGDASFQINSVYLIYGMFLFVCLEKELVASGQFKWFFGVPLYLGVVLLVPAHFLGIGRFDFPPRYNGFMNDPNQMAFWCLCATSSFFLACEVRTWLKMVLLVCSGYVVLATMSRSGVVGFLFVFLGAAAAIAGTHRPTAPLRPRKSAFETFLKWGVALAAIGCCLVWLNDLISDGSLDIVERLLSTDLDTEVGDRGYGRLEQFPQYLLFGAGHGRFERFNADLEIHSTWAALLFYYGFFGFGCFAAFTFNVARRLRFEQALLFAGPLGYSLSTFGFRSPIFWVFLAAATVAASVRTIHAAGPSLPLPDSPS